MKNIWSILLSVIVVTSCTDLESFNVDEKNATTAAPETFFSNAQFNLAKEVFNVSYTASGPGASRMFAQHITAVTYIEGTRYIKAFNWTPLYRDVLADLKAGKDILQASETTNADEESLKNNKLALFDLMSIYTYANLVDSYGNIPYSEALDFNNPLPVFDDAQTVYVDLMSKLDDVIARLSPAAGNFGNADLIYKGNTALWLKFANSLKLRMGMRIIDVLPDLATTAVSSAINSGMLIQDNSENTLFHYLSESPNTNPWWTTLVRDNLKYYVGTNRFIDYMNSVNDPRIGIYFGDVGGQYIGGAYGEVIPYASYSPVSDYFRNPTAPSIFFDHSAVEFLLAEAAERGIATPSPAQVHYENAIRASFEYWGASGVDDYLAQSNVNYATAPGDWKEKIGLQKWVALFDQGFEAWTEYRRLDHPSFLQPAPNSESAVVLKRFTYPISEQTLNGGSWKQAADAMGGDLYEVPIFWDIH